MLLCRITLLWIFYILFFFCWIVRPRRLVSFANLYKTIDYLRDASSTSYAYSTILRWPAFTGRPQVKIYKISCHLLGLMLTSAILSDQNFCKISPFEKTFQMFSHFVSNRKHNRFCSANQSF